MSLQKDTTMQLAFAIIDEDQANKFIKEAVKCGCRGGFIAPAKGMVTSELLNSLSLRERKRRMVLFIEPSDILTPTLEHLNNLFKMNQANHGIMFTMNLNHALYPRSAKQRNFPFFQSPYQLFVALFRHERRSNIIHIIQNQNAKGGTIFTGRGEFIEEQTAFLGLHSSPQKDVLLSVMEKEIIPEVFHDIDQKFDIVNTKGMMIQSLDVLAFSKSSNPLNFVDTPDTELAILFMIIDAQLLEKYRECLQKHGWRGGTSIKASGTMNPDYMEQVFNMTINPEKRIIFTIDQTYRIQSLYQALFDDPHIDPSHYSVSFVIGVEDSYGIRHA